MPYNPESQKTKDFFQRLKDRSLTPEAALKDLHNHYKKKAKRRGYTWNLNLEDCRRLIAQNCSYCGSSPNRIHKNKYGGEILYNGIDRKDNSLGYEIGNVVPCCKFCNFAKHKHSMEEFQAWLDDIAAYYPTLLAKELSKEQP